MRRLGAVVLLIAVAGCGASEVAPVPSPSPTPGAAGRFVYVISPSGRNVSAYAVAENGTLSAMDSVTMPNGVVPSAIAADPLGHFLFVARSGDRGGIQAFALDRTSGRLREVPGSPFDLDHQTDFLTPEPRGRFLWATRALNGEIDTFSIDASTGQLTASSGTSLTGAPGEPVLRPDGRFLYVPIFAPEAVFRYVADDAAGRLVAAAPHLDAPDVVRSLTVDPAGAFLYMTTATPFTSNTLFLYRIDAAAGALARVPGSVFAPGFDPAAADLRPDRITFHPSGRFAYVSDRPGRTGAHSRGFWAFTVGSGGLLGPGARGPFSTPASAGFLIGDPVGLALDPAGRFAYAIDTTSDSISAFAIDEADGALTPVGAPVATEGAPATIIVVP